jgi:hypothetical protein
LVGLGGSVGGCVCACVWGCVCVCLCVCVCVGGGSLTAHCTRMYTKNIQTFSTSCQTNEEFHGVAEH